MSSSTKFIQLKANFKCKLKLNFYDNVELHNFNEELRDCGYSKTSLKEIGEIWCQKTPRDERQQYIFDYLKESIIDEYDPDLDSIKISSTKASKPKKLW